MSTMDERKFREMYNTQCEVIDAIAEALCAHGLPNDVVIERAREMTIRAFRAEAERDSAKRLCDIMRDHHDREARELRAELDVVRSRLMTVTIERDTLREEVARLNTLLLSATGENQKRAEREARALEDWRELRAENDRLKASRLPDVEYARLDTMWQQLVRERDAAVAKATAHERDWYEAKSEFGTAAAKLRDQVRASQAEAAEARRDLGEILAVIHRDGGHYTGEHGISKSVADAHAAWAAVVRERDKLRAERRQLRARLVECLPFVGVCPREPNQIQLMQLVRDLADDTLEEVKP